MSEYIHKSHNVTVLLYHLVFPAKYRRAVFDEAVDGVLKEVYCEKAGCIRQIFRKYLENLVFEKKMFCAMLAIMVSPRGIGVSGFSLSFPFWGIHRLLWAGEDLPALMWLLLRFIPFYAVKGLEGK